MQEPLSMQSRALERRTVPDGVWVGYGYQLVALNMTYGVCGIGILIFSLLVRSWAVMLMCHLVCWPAYLPICMHACPPARVGMG